jgi:hypothetical protein
MVHLVRLVVADDWQPFEAPTRLDLVGDTNVLLQMAARVRVADVEHRSRYSERATQTLAGALRVQPS